MAVAGVAAVYCAVAPAAAGAVAAVDVAAVHCAVVAAVAVAAAGHAGQTTLLIAPEWPSGVARIPGSAYATVQPTEQFAGQTMSVAGMPLHHIHSTDQRSAIHQCAS